MLGYSSGWALSLPSGTREISGPFEMVYVGHLVHGPRLVWIATGMLAELFKSLGLGTALGGDLCSSSG